MTKSSSHVSRRQALLLGTGLLALPAIARGDTPKRGGTLTYVFRDESPALVAVNNTSSTAWTLGPKIFDALLSYDVDLSPKPQLATEWTISPDGLHYTFKLRPNVQWHDGNPFTSDDVAFSILHLKVAHPRGRGTFANVERVETPDPLTAVINLSKPAPALISALAATESPIIPKHLFEGADPAAPPTPAQLVGTGPFVFKEWVRGSHVVVERNPNYWDAPRPYLDRIIFRFIPDAAARSAGFQTGEIDLGGNSPVPLADLERLKTLPHVGVDTRSFAYTGAQQQLIFNLDNTYLKDQKVRLAIAHAIDLKAIVETIFYGYATVSPSPVSVALPQFHDRSIQPHAFDVALANRILDEAGYAKGPDGNRFSSRLLINAAVDPRLADFHKQALKRIGIDAAIQRFDFATYVKTVYTDRAFDLTSETLSNAFDPTVGVQRVYWSKNFKVGLPFSNAAHYQSAEADTLLEAGAVEPDPVKRREIFNRFQAEIDRDLPAINLVAPHEVIVFNKRVRNYAPGGEGLNGNFAGVYLDS
ncbi:ABC transporter substrate-binding protein [Chelatococcus asaccharovorans]|uniref:Peptide/nickel transport system substrate-binding protein n=1 Tax=Chelatococcus asaccharovorans TaxID=28210 RepID=A0A2V3U4Q7_9HYPH|nr:ABC transporter substrate-binding protein [Chelatococcus asaccharovorans]MBS7703771.1 ABC transporter substrate-binding protein [Chelatococcus asaccharovorans]PXW57931.1 peptide/nickel transport system substrate-binding protein [Chelatococcus asaccharovorans]